MKQDYIKSAIEDHIKVVSNLDIYKIIEVGKLIVHTLKNNGKIILFGNGGSASDSEHIAAEFVGHFKKNRSSLSAISLVSSGPLITAIGNDFGFDNIFSRQIPGIAFRKDICIGISTSGKSKNVLIGLKEAKRLGCKTVLMSGINPELTDGIYNVIIKVPSTTTSRIQEAHILIGHILCDYVETYFYLATKIEIEKEYHPIFL